MNDVEILVDRLSKININIEMWSNFPWIYLYKVNGNIVTERFMAEHGFTIAFHPIRPNEMLKFTDISEIFKVIRKYRNVN